jgi:flavin reductase (DIM6/NTAB) family NADH-FMN oxidoreductase RutF
VSTVQIAPWQFLSTSVGLITTEHGDTFNAMAAEWTYFVSRDPLHVAVALGDECLTTRLVADNREFSVTLCSEEQAPLANLLGSFSGRDVDKLSSDLVALEVPLGGGIPWVTGGVFSAACTVVDAIRLPRYTLFIALATDLYVPPGRPRRPLVKSGDLYTLRSAVRRRHIAATATMIGTPPTHVRVAATDLGGADLTEPWRVTVRAGDGRRPLSLESGSNAYGDLMVDIGTAAWEPADGEIMPIAVRVQRHGAVSGSARAWLLQRYSPDRHGAAVDGSAIPDRQPQALIK